MKKIAVYGKGGIGKSTTTSALSAAISNMGYKVMQIGCDPKADSTINLTNGKPVTPVMNYLKEYGACKSLNAITSVGYNGIVCAEAGGPTPGFGCAGRGIITAFNVLEELKAFEIYKPDYVFYDVLGDVVCGGFAMPIREGYADEVIIVSSGEKMSLYAAKNIKTAVDNFADRNYARLRGMILNRRNVENEEIIVRKFAAENGIDIIGDIPRDSSVQLYEDRNMTAIQGNPNSVYSRAITGVAQCIVDDGSNHYEQSAI
ncbi:MAG: nitrogenase iron protein NifH [Bacillota bacterium]|nr:nitrogenase iron protein NifH [Bacillota bacterium]